MTTCDLLERPIAEPDWYEVDDDHAPAENTVAVAAVLRGLSWVSVFDDDDKAEFVNELLDAGEDVHARAEVIHDWQVTAHALSDPHRRAVLLGSFRGADFVDALPPS